MPTPADSSSPAPAASRPPRSKRGVNGKNDTPAPPPAYFLSMKVANFRCFGPEQTLDLSDGNGRPAQWTIILGENSVGKTTLLQSLAATQPPQLYFLIGSGGIGRAYGLRNRFGLYYSWKSRQSPQYEYNLVFGSRLSDENHVFNKKTATARLFGSEYDSYEPYLAIMYLDSQEEYDELAMPICYGYGASRQAGKTTLSEEPNDDTCVSLFDETAPLINAEEWLVQTDYATKTGTPLSKRRAKNRLKQITELLAGSPSKPGLLPNVSDFRFKVADNASMTPRVEAKTPYGWVRIADLSLGYKTALTWMIDLASRLFDRYPNSPNPLAEPAVVLIDEIDLHLHPRWQRDLVRLLGETFPNTQFIVTAHSPLIVQAAGADANLVLLRREGDHVVIENDVDEIRNWRVDQILTSDLFGLETARPPQVEPLLRERRELLAKPHLDAADRERVTELEALIGDLPTGETPQDIEAMDFIREFAAVIREGAGATNGTDQNGDGGK